MFSQTALNNLHRFDQLRRRATSLLLQRRQTRGALRRALGQLGRLARLAFQLRVCDVCGHPVAVAVATGPL
jgi:hypothetical protein